MLGKAVMTYVNLAVALFAYDGPDKRVPKAEDILKQVGTELKCSHNYDFDYARMSVLWPAGYCSVSERACKPELMKNDFMIEGTKPMSYDGIHPMYCCLNKEFKQDEVPEFQWVDIENNWRSLHEKWRDAQVVDEWVKHGTCARKMNDYIKNQQTYVGNTLRIFERLELLKFMQDNKFIGQGESQLINGRALQESLRQVTNGKLARVECKENILADDTVQLIFTGLQFCYDKKYNNIDCEMDPSRAACLGEITVVN